MNNKIENLLKLIFIAIGTSLQVIPASYIPQYAVRNGAKFVILNQTPTMLDSIADVVINEKLDKVVYSMTDYL